MKKNYISPVVMVVNVNEALMANGMSNVKAEGGSTNFNNSTGSGRVLSRQNSSWDDDED